MAITVRCVPAFGSGGNVVGSVGPSQQPTKVYQAAGGSVIDCALGEEATLVSQGFIVLCFSGAAATRRASTPGGYFRPGQLWLDTDSAGQGIIVFDGATRRAPTGAAVA